MYMSKLLKGIRSGESLMDVFWFLRQCVMKKKLMAYYGLKGCVGMSRDTSSMDPKYYIWERKREALVNREEYLRTVYNYIEYYHNRAAHYKGWYLTLNVIKLIFLALIPVSEIVVQNLDLPWLAAGASSLCILLESIMGLFHMKDKWTQYRRTENDLMSEERQYVTLSGRYHVEENSKRFNMFVENVENIISNEAVMWSRMIAEKQQTEG